MPTLIGTSDAWKSVCLELGRINLKPDKPSDIHKSLETFKEEYTQAKVKATQDIENKIDTIKQDIERHENNFDVDIQRGKSELDERIKSTKLKLQSLQSSFIQRLFNYFKIRKNKKLLRHLIYKHDNYPTLVQGRIDQLKNSLVQMQKDSDAIIDKEIQVVARKVRLIEKVLKSPELAGGIAELELIESLKSLPSNCYIINDVLIELRRAIHFDGDWLKSAQIDHIVVTPSGIFCY